LRKRAQFVLLFYLLKSSFPLGEASEDFMGCFFASKGGIVFPANLEEIEASSIMFIQ
jgi:hypothetical protein